MKRKPRRRPVHYTTSAFADGAVFGCYSDRAPSPQRIKRDRLRIDADFVAVECRYSAAEFRGWPEAQRIRASGVLANRMNVRRALREIAVPVLEELKTGVEDLRRKLVRIEQSTADEASQ